MCSNANMSNGTSHSPKIYDAIIVGAGLSGLSAALQFHTSTDPKLSYLVLEARDRVGGKTLTTARPDGKGNQELGAAWINDTNQSRMWDLAQRYGMTARSDEFVIQNVQGDVVVHDIDHTAEPAREGFGAQGKAIRFPYGSVPEYDKKEYTDDCVFVRDLVQGFMQDEAFAEPGSQRRKDLDAMSFEEFLWHSKIGVKGRLTARVWTHAMLGVDPSEVSALYFMEYCKCGGGLMNMRSDGKGGGQYLRLKRGTSGFARALLGDLDKEGVLFGQVVKRIKQHSQDEAYCVVETAAGDTYACKKLIVSVPSPVYKTISFDPPLPPEKSMVANQTAYGCYTKYLVLFSQPFWRQGGYCGLSQSFIGPVSVTRDTSVDDEDNFAMTCFVGGVFGREWTVFGAEDKKQMVLKQLADMFLDGKVEELTELCVGVLESPWMNEEWSGFGCPCPVMRPGSMEGGNGIAALRRPFGNIHFVGTEMADVWRGYMEGAVRSGETGAKDVMGSLART